MKSIVILLLLSTTFFSQNKALSIKGKILSKDGTPLEYALVKLMDAQNSKLITGEKTNAKGVFTFDNIQTGSYSIQIDMIGYKKKIMPISIQNESIDLKTIALESTKNTIDEVVISGNKASKASQIDKKIYTPSQILSSQNGTASELINNIPSINISKDDNNVNFRGDGNVTILINGKISTLTGENLNQIPATAIERVEVLSNPSSKYNSDGSAGIINIILKDANLSLNNGFVSVSAGTRDKYNAQIGYNWSFKKLAVSAAYNYRYEKRYNDGYTFRSYLNGTSINRFNQLTLGESFKPSHFGRLALDYEFNQNNSLSLNGSYSISWQNQYETKQNEQLDFLSSNSIPFNQWNRIGTENDRNQVYEATMTYKHTFPNSSNILNVEVSHNGNRNDKGNNIIQPYYRLNYATIDSTTNNQFDNYQNRVTTIAQMDLTTNLNSKHRIESGLRGSWKDFQFNSSTYLSSNRQPSNMLDSALSNQFNYLEDLFSLYGLWSGNWNERFSTKLGVRLEQTNTRSYSYHQELLYQYNYFSAFPSAILDYKFGKAQHISSSYSLRINRPGPGMLNPLQDVTDPLSLRYGNPFLKPEYVNSFELGYGNDEMKKVSFSTSLYYKMSTNAITRYVETNSNGILQVKIDNLGKMNSAGWEMIMNYKATKFLNIAINSNLSYVSLEYNASNATYSNDYLNFQGRLVTSVRLPWDMEFQAIGFIKTPMKTPQGTLATNSNIDLTLRKKIMGQKGIITAGITDMLNDTKFLINITDANFNTESLRKKETRVFTIGFRYNFGKDPSKKSKLEKLESKPETPQDMGM